MKEGEGMTNPAKRAQKRAEQLRIERKKHIRNTVIAGLIIAAVELALLFMLGHAVIHTDYRYATQENTREVYLTDFTVHSASRSPYFTIIASDGYEYSFPMFYAASCNANKNEFREQLPREDALRMRIKGDSKIVALSGTERTYFTMFNHNSYQMTQDINCGILYGVLQLIWLLGFVVYIGWGFDIWIWAGIVAAYQRWRKKRGLPQKQKKERTQKEQERLAVIILCSICGSILIVLLVVLALSRTGKLPVG